MLRVVLNNIMSKLYCTYRNHVTIRKKRKKAYKKQQQNKQKQQENIIAPVYITGGDAIRQLP